MPLYWLSAIGPKSDGSRSPNIEGTDGSSPITALTIWEINKDYLISEEFSWVYAHHWRPARPTTEHNESWDEFSRNASHETKRIGRSVYDLIVVKLPAGESRPIYFDVTRQRFDWPRIK